MEHSVVRGGRRFTSHLPLFGGYVFFRGDAAARQTALRSNVVARLIEVDDQALFNGELQQIRKLQLAGASFIPVEEFPKWEAGVHALYDRMARIDITPTWVKIHDFETRIPQAVEDLARAKFGGG